MKKILFTLTIVLIAIASASAQCGTNLLTNPGFDAPIQTNIGDNLTGSFTFNGWTMTGGPFNIIRTDGSPYGAAPDNAKDGSQYVEVAFSAGTVYQDFTIAQAGTPISFGGYFSGRVTGYPAWLASIEIFSMPSNILVSTSTTRLFTDADGVSSSQETWHYLNGNVTLPAGDYRYVANIGDNGNFDAAFVYVNCILPIKLLSFTALLQNNNDAKLQWKIATAEEGSKYELQRSSDGSVFTTINRQTGNATHTQFGYTDNSLSHGTYYYRLKMTDKTGKVTYSNIAILKIGSKEQLISVYPNPVLKSSSLQISLQNITANKIEMINSAGQIVYSNSAKLTGSINLPVSSSLAPGQYTLRVISENKIETRKILIQ